MESFIQSAASFLPLPACRSVEYVYILLYSAPESAKKFYAGQVHYRANMRLHNRENLINFVAVPGSYRNFHGKSGQTFL